MEKFDKELLGICCVGPKDVDLGAFGIALTAPTWFVEVKDGTGRIPAEDQSIEVPPVDAVGRRGGAGCSGALLKGCGGWTGCCGCSGRLQELEELDVVPGVSAAKEPRLSGVTVPDLD